MPFRFNPFTKKLDIVDTTAIPPGVVATLTGNDGVAVPPDGANNINVLGDHVALMGYAAYVSGNAGTNTITIKTPGLGVLWQVVAADQTAVAGHGYLSTKGTQLNITLPATPGIGDAFVVSDVGGHKFQIVQNAGDSIQIGDLFTTTGVGGSITSIDKGDTLMVICWAIGPGASWIAIPQVGNFTVV